MNEDQARIIAEEMLDNCNDTDGCPYCAGYTLDEVTELVQP